MLVSIVYMYRLVWYNVMGDGMRAVKFWRGRGETLYRANQFCCICVVWYNVTKMLEY